jgi:Fe2+ or Zn2+ uptake regulation protein
MQGARQYLLSFGVRPSVQRVAVMDYLMNHRTHPTAEEIYGALKERIASLLRMTVYNTLKMLSGVRAVREIDIDGHTMRYDGFTDFHAHFMCRNCGRIEDIAIADPAPFSAVEATGTVDDMQFLLKGCCAKCAKKSAK